MDHEHNLLNRNPVQATIKPMPDLKWRLIKTVQIIMIHELIKLILGIGRVPWPMATCHPISNHHIISNESERTISVTELQLLENWGLVCKVYYSE